MMLARPLGSIRGSSSSSPRISASSSQRQLDFQDVPPRLRRPAWPCPSSPSRPADRLSDLALPLTHAPRPVATIAKLRRSDLRQRDRDQLLARLADHLAVGDVLAQVGLDLSTHDLLESIRVPLDLAHHDEYPCQVLPTRPSR